MNNAYIIKTYRTPAEVKEYVLDNLLENYNQANKHFFCHILFGTQNTIKRLEDGWVPISAKLMKKEWGNTKIEWEQMVTEGLLEVKVLDKIEVADGVIIEQTYSKTSGISRCFRVNLEVLEEILDIFPSKADEFIGGSYYNLVNGKKMNVFKRHKLTDENENSIPELVKNSMTSIERCVVNAKALEDYLNEARFNIGIKDSSLLENRKELKRYIHNKGCYNSMMETSPKRISEDLVEYYPSYEVQMSGRITELGGGLQSATREMKAVAFSNIPNLKNYDLKSSQVWGLIQQFEVAHLDTSWLKAYLDVDKKEYADKVGISKDRWKQCFMALVMGGYLPSAGRFKKAESFENVDSAIIQYLSEEFEGDDEKTLEAYIKFYNLVQPFKKELDKWQDWLIETYIPLVSTYPKGKQYVNNKTGVTFCISDYKNADGKWKDLNQLKRKISAFFLQGTEAAFIHHLTWVSKQYGYEVLNNQHDGLVTIGEIPEKAVEYARQASGLKYASLEEKPLN